MRPSITTRARSAGFSLVEVMIGLLIGMIATIVILQVFSLSEGYKRTTTGGDDAQNNGAISMYAIQRDLQQSGLATSALHMLGCDVQLRTGVTLNAMAPVTINHASIPASVRDANTDSLLIVYGSTNGSGEGERIEAQPATRTYTVASAASSASAVGAFASNDRVIVAPATRATPCTLTLEPVTSVSGTGVSVGTGVASMSGGVIYNIGGAPRVVVYAIRGGNLVVCDYTVNDCGAIGNVGNTSVWVPIGSSIVSLRAEYGRDTTAPSMDGTVDTFDQTTPNSACLWARVSAVRLAVVARSSAYDKAIVATAAPTWASATNTIDLSGNTDWQHYRYKLFQTVVPLRNVAWQGAQQGC